MKRRFDSNRDVIFDRINYIIMTLVVISVIYPLYFIVIASISEPNAVYQGRTWLFPTEVTWEGYRRIFSFDAIWLGYRNTIVYTVLGTLISIAVTLPGAYALSRKDLVGGKLITLLITFTMIFSGGLIPTYLLVKNLHITNTIWAMVLPNAVIVGYLIVAKAFFQSTIPDELHDAAKIDGCSDNQFFLRIVLPLSKALIAIMVLYYAVRNWNAYFEALIYLSDEKLYPLQLVLRSILIASESSDMATDLTLVEQQQRAAELMRYGVVIVAALPLLVLYPFLQKYFVKGVMIGSLKG